MKSYVLVICAALLVSASAHAQNRTGVQGNAQAGAQTSASAAQGEASTTSSGSASANAGANQADASLASGTELNATLVKSVDAGKNKPGDEVSATAAQDIKSGGQVVIPRGSRLIGRVTKAQPRGKSGTSGGGSAGGSADSQLGIVFERAVLKDGRQVPLSATVQAVAASAASVGSHGTGAAASGASSGAASGRAAGGGLVGSVGGAATGTVGAVADIGGSVGSTLGGTVSRSAGATGGLNAAGRLTSGSRGVFGMQGLDITSGAAGSAEGSLITSATRNVRLGSGTQMLLVTGAHAAGSSGAASGPDTGRAVNAAGNVSGTANAAGSVGRAARDAGSSGGEAGESAQEPVDRSDKR